MDDTAELYCYAIEIIRDENRMFVARWDGMIDSVQGAGKTKMEAIACLAACTAIGICEDESEKWIKPFTKADKRT